MSTERIPNQATAQSRSLTAEEKQQLIQNLSKNLDKLATDITHLEKKRQALEPGSKEFINISNQIKGKEEKLLQGSKALNQLAPHSQPKIAKNTKRKIQQLIKRKQKKAKAKAQAAAAAPTNNASAQDASQASKKEDSWLEKWVKVLVSAIIGAFSSVGAALASPIKALKGVFSPKKDSPTPEPTAHSQTSLQASAGTRQNYVSHPQPGQGYQTPLPNQQNGPQNQAYFNDNGEPTRIHVKGSDFMEHMNTRNGTALHINAPNDHMVQVKESGNRVDINITQPNAPSSSSNHNMIEIDGTEYHITAPDNSSIRINESNGKVNINVDQPRPVNANINAASPEPTFPKPSAPTLEDTLASESKPTNPTSPTPSAPRLEDTLATNTTGSSRMPSFASAAEARPPAYAPAYTDINRPAADTGTAPTSAQQNITSAPMGSFTGSSMATNSTPGGDAPKPKPKLNNQQDDSQTQTHSIDGNRPVHLNIRGSNGNKITRDGDKLHITSSASDNVEVNKSSNKVGINITPTPTPTSSWASTAHDAQNDANASNKASASARR